MQHVNMSTCNCQFIYSPESGIVDIEVVSYVDPETFVPATISDFVRTAINLTVNDGRIGSEEADPRFVEVQEPVLGKFY